MLSFAPIEALWSDNIAQPHLFGYNPWAMTDASSRSWLRALLAALVPTFREVAALSFFVNLLALAVPIFVMQVYDRVVYKGGMTTLQVLCLGMALVLVFDFVLRQSRARILQVVALRVDVLVGRRLFDQVTRLPLMALEAQPAAHWQALFRDIDTVRGTLSGATALLVCDLPFTLLFLALAFVIATPIAWVIVVMMPLFVFVAWRSGAVLTERTAAERQKMLSRDTLLAEIIAGRTTVKALALDGVLRPEWEQRHAATIDGAMRRGSAADSYATLAVSLAAATTVAVMTVGAMAVVHQRLSVGALIAANMLSGRLTGPLNRLVANWRSFAQFRQAARRLGQVFAMAVDRADGALDFGRPRGLLAVEGVIFAFADGAQPIFDGLDLTISPGGITALVGRNGSGKTTLLKLLQGLYAPQRGRVLLDGADVAQFSRSDLAAVMGYVPQESVLLSGPLRDSIAARVPDADDAAILRAATLAGAHAFIIDLPDGYRTEVGEGGHRLSAGQRQRLGIARALVGDPPVLLFDEPSASLDRQAEQELRSTLVQLAKERTIVLVSHSPVLLSAARTIVVLEQGRVALSGPAEAVLPRLFNSDRPATAAAPPNISVIKG
jgi:ATP-binding cassette subfamily C protein LapB